VDAIIFEAGNGFPGVGDVVEGEGGELWRVVATNGVIHTDRPTKGNYIFAQVVDDGDEDDIFPAEIEFEGDSDDEGV
jgi:hypothetical protein